MMKKSILASCLIISFLFLNINKMESQENKSQIKEFIEKFEDEFKNKYSLDSNYIKNVYYQDGFSRIKKLSARFGNHQITRIAKGYQSIKEVIYLGKTATHPDIWETVFYFVDDKLFCGQNYIVMADFNANPSNFWETVTSDMYYFKEDSLKKHIKYQYSTGNIAKASSEYISNKIKVEKKSGFDQESYIIKKAYRWFNATDEDLYDEDLKDLINTYENSFLKTASNTITIFKDITEHTERISTIYYNDGKNVTTKDSETFGDIEVTRIGYGYFRNITTPISSPYTAKTQITYPDFAETVYYFINGKLFKAKKLKSGTDYNFNPANYWVNIYTAEYYFKNDEEVEPKNYFQFGMQNIGEKQEVNIDYKLFNGIDPVKEAYELLNSDE